MNLIKMNNIKGKYYLGGWELPNPKSLNPFTALALGFGLLLIRPFVEDIGIKKVKKKWS